jgi:hypothetical protein
MVGASLAAVVESLMSGRYSFSSLQSTGGGLHVENLGFVAGGSVSDAACRLRTRKCPRAAYSMIHAAPTCGRIFTGTSQQHSPEAFDLARSDRSRSFRSIQKNKGWPRYAFTEPGPSVGHPVAGAVGVMMVLGSSGGLLLLRHSPCRKVIRYAQSVRAAFASKAARQ